MIIRPDVLRVSREESASSARFLPRRQETADRVTSEAAAPPSSLARTSSEAVETLNQLEMVH